MKRLKLKCPFCDGVMDSELSDKVQYYCSNNNCCFRFINVFSFHIEDIANEINELKEYINELKEFKYMYENLFK